MNQKIESLEGESVTEVVQSRLELKIKELESKLELEQTTRGRMETQVKAGAPHRDVLDQDALQTWGQVHKTLRNYGQILTVNIYVNFLPKSIDGIRREHHVI